MRTCGLTISGLSLIGLILSAAEPRAPAVALTFSPDGRHLLVGAHREVRVHSVDGGKAEAVLPSVFPRISALAFSPDSKTIAASGGTPGVDGGVLLLEWPKGTIVACLTNHTDQGTAVAFNPGATLLASAGADGVVQVLHWPDRTPAYRLEGHSGPVLAAVFSPDGELLVTASADRSLKVWEAASGKLRRSFSHHTDIVHCLAFRPRPASEGDAVPLFCVSGSQDKTVRMWQPAIGRMVRIVRGHEGPIFAIVCNPEGTRIYSAGKEGVLRIIDTDSDQILHAWAAHEDWIYSLALSPDGRLLASGDWAGTVKLWNVRETPAKLQSVWAAK